MATTTETRARPATAPPAAGASRARAGHAWRANDTYVYGTAGLLLFLLAWWGSTTTGVVDAKFLTPPQDVWAALVAGFGERTSGAPLLKEQIVPSVQRALYGFLIATGLGIVLGILVGSLRTLEKLLEPVLLFFRSLSILALFPVFLLFFGIGEESKIAIVAWAAFFPVFVTTANAVKGVERILVHAARTLGAGRVWVFTRVVLPAAVPNIFPGLRLGASYAFTALVAAEYLGATAGIGIFIRSSQEGYAIPQMYAGIVVLGVLGVVLNVVLMAAERRVTGWQHGLTSR